MLQTLSQYPPSPHTLKAAEAVALYGGNIERGLTENEADQRLAQHGPNSLPVGAARPAWLRFLAHFRDVQVYLLFAAAAVSFIVWLLDSTEPWPIEAIAIVAIVLLNALFGYLQEERADAALSALRSMTPDMASVLRNSEVHRIQAHRLVPGDLLLIDAGDRIAADARLIDVTAFYTQEAALTGESLPVLKTAVPMPESTPLSDRKNMVYSGTVAVSGHARAIATARATPNKRARMSNLPSWIPCSSSIVPTTTATITMTAAPKRCPK